MSQMATSDLARRHSIWGNNATEKVARLDAFINVSSDAGLTGLNAVDHHQRSVQLQHRRDIDGAEVSSVDIGGVGSITGQNSLVSSSSSSNDIGGVPHHWWTVDGQWPPALLTLSDGNGLLDSTSLISPLLLKAQDP